jgi:hypothetical protein
MYLMHILLNSIDADMKSEIGSSRGGLRPYPLRFHVEEAGADAKFNQHGPLGVAYHCRHPISTVPVARITAHATVPGSVNIFLTKSENCSNQVNSQRLTGFKQLTRKNIIARTVSSRFFEQSNFEQMIMTRFELYFLKYGRIEWFKNVFKNEFLEIGFYREGEVGCLRMGLVCGRHGCEQTYCQK